MLKEAGGQVEVNRAHCPVVQNKACPAYACRADGKTSSLQKLETWLIVIAQLISIRERGFREVLSLKLAL